MTLEQVKSWGTAARPWAPYVGLVVLALLLVHQCNGRSRTEAELSRLEEQRELEEKGQEVIDPVPDVRPRVEELERENDELRAALEEAKRAAPGATAIAAARSSTGPLRVEAPTLAPPTAVPKQEEPAPAANAPVCVLAAGDEGEVRVDQVVLETKDGNQLFVGTGEAWRLTPGPAARLFGGRFQAPVTWAVEKAVRANAAPGWSAGPLAGASGQGWLLGALLTTPEGRVPLVGWHVSGELVGAGGPSQGLVLAGFTIRP